MTARTQTTDDLSAMDIDALRAELRYLRMRLSCEQASMREILATGEEIERERNRLLAEASAAGRR